MATREKPTCGDDNAPNANIKNQTEQNDDFNQNNQNQDENRKYIPKPPKLSEAAKQNGWDKPLTSREKNIHKDNVTRMLNAPRYEHYDYYCSKLSKEQIETIIYDIANNNWNFLETEDYLITLLKPGDKICITPESFAKQRGYNSIDELPQRGQNRQIRGGFRGGYSGGGMSRRGLPKRRNHNTTVWGDPIVRNDDENFPRLGAGNYHNDKPYDDIELNFEQMADIEYDIRLREREGQSLGDQIESVQDNLQYEDEIDSLARHRYNVLKRLLNIKTTHERQKQNSDRTLFINVTADQDVGTMLPHHKLIYDGITKHFHLRDEIEEKNIRQIFKTNPKDPWRWCVIFDNPDTKTKCEQSNPILSYKDVQDRNNTITYTLQTHSKKQTILITLDHNSNLSDDEFLIILEKYGQIQRLTRHYLEPYAPHVDSGMRTLVLQLNDGVKPSTLPRSFTDSNGITRQFHFKGKPYFCVKCYKNHTIYETCTADTETSTSVDQVETPTGESKKPTETASNQTEQNNEQMDTEESVDTPQGETTTPTVDNNEQQSPELFSEPGAGSGVDGESSTSGSSSQSTLESVTDSDATLSQSVDSTPHQTGEGSTENTQTSEDISDWSATQDPAHKQENTQEHTPEQSGTQSTQDSLKQAFDGIDINTQGAVVVPETPPEQMPLPDNSDMEMDPKKNKRVHPDTDTESQTQKKQSKRKQEQPTKSLTNGLTGFIGQGLLGNWTSNITKKKHSP